MDALSAIEAKYRLLAGRLDEATLRLWVAAEAQSLGRGGVSLVAKAAGVSRTTVYAGLAEIQAAGATPKAREVEVPTKAQPGRRVRAQGAGRKKLTDQNPALLEALDALVDPASRGGPMPALRWTCKSTTRLAQELGRQGHRVSQRTVCDLLAQLNYSLQSTRQAREGGRHPDRDGQFQHIAQAVAQYQRQRQPVISVDMKKKELGKPGPHGTHDMAANEGWVSMAISHDTAELAVQSIRRWWLEMGQPLYPKARLLLITADCGGNGFRVRLWRLQLQHLADEAGLTIQVCHLPPGTSKWSKIKHRMSCDVTHHWCGQPLLMRQIVVKLIGSVGTTHALRARAALGKRAHDAAGLKVKDDELAAIAMEQDEFHGEWNYRIRPRPPVAG